MDVIALHGAGFTNSVATLGTAITPDQARLMKRYTKKVIISYDSDEAGQRAADKAFRLLSDVGLEARMLKLTGGAKDPDEFIRKYGKLAFTRLLEDTKTEFEHKFELILQQNDISSVAGKVKAGQSAVELISRFPSSVERSIYIQKAADALELDGKMLLSDVEKLIKKNNRQAEKERSQKIITASAGYMDRVNPQYVRNPGAASAEEAIIGMLLLQPEHILKVCEPSVGLTADDFATEFNRRVFEAIISHARKDESFDEGFLSAEFSEAETGRIIKMKVRRMELANNTETVMKECVAKLRESKSKKDINDVNDLKEMIENKRRKNNE